MAGFDAWFFYEPAATSTANLPTLDATDVAATLGATAATPLGSGAFGETWRIDLPPAGSRGGSGGRGEIRAAKIIVNPSYPADRLGREVEGLQRVDHNSVVKLLDASGVTFSVGQRAVLQFEFVDGGDVAGSIARAEFPDDAGLAAFAVALLEAVCALHSVEALHRDIKPENIALRGGDWSTPVLLDLGLVKLLDATSLTAYPALMGTAPFMAPEQVRGEHAKKASDVWAVGAVLYVLAAHGAHPFYDRWPDRVLTAEAIARMQAGPRPLPGSVDPVTARLINTLMSFELHERGSARRALSLARDALAAVATPRGGDAR